MTRVLVHFGLVLVHVLAAAITLGATVTYEVAISLAERDPTHLAFTIGAVRRSDRLLGIPAFLVAGLTGLLITVNDGLPLDRFLLATALTIYVLLLGLGFTVFGPVVRREMVALERGGAADPAYRRLRGQARALSYGTIAAFVVIFGLMVAKPS